MSLPMKNQPKIQSVSQPRDQFQTPKYAVDLIVPFIRTYETILDPASGMGFLSQDLRLEGFCVKESDISPFRVGQRAADFLTDDPQNCDLIITNPPYSLKFEFVDRALDLGIPFLMLVPGNYNGQMIRHIKKGCKKIVPEQRINYITPDIRWLVEKGETFRYHKDRFSSKEKKDISKQEWIDVCSDFGEPYRYDEIEDIPDELISRYSSSQFHSVWLGKLYRWPQAFDAQTEIFVKIDPEAKKFRVLP